MHRTTRRAATLCAATAVAALCAAGPAQAADGPAAPAASDYAAAQQVLRSDQVHSTVARFLTTTGHPAPAAGADGGTAGGDRRGLAQPPAPAPHFDLRKPVPLYELAPEFVTGRTRPTAGTALRLSGLASRVSAADGHQAAVFLMPKPGSGSWHLAGIRDGEADIGAAERGTEQARTFLEPQLHAWYRLTGAGTVEPLNKEASTALQGEPHVTLAAYQQLVAKRYGDKLPGSSYDRKGLAGGYALAEDAGQQPGTATSASWLPAAFGTVALAASGAAVAALRRRRRAA
ncbi:hypothetical protein ACMATS_02500 [Streptoverticillium reticulum]|uniref:hypothetical protein n=1 Tax=Streptoverticillium reticulum TaxID=1433415 RepID=UPI0039BFBA63